MNVVREKPGNEEKRHILDVPGIARELHVQLKRYIEAQYPIRHASVVAERQALLETPGVIAREPFIESTPGYTPGPSYSELALPPHMIKALEEFASWDQPNIPARLYRHQAQALEAFLGHDNDLVVVTGTGSGKTETFLLPILLRSFEEARLRPRSFELSSMRALIIYPMNALVNDQLTRLRALFGDPRLASWLRQRCNVKRPVRFGMYTSRTPYPGMMSDDKNSRQLRPLLEYYLKLEQEQPEQTKELKKHGRWPECDLAALYAAMLTGKPRVGDNDYELFTRHQMQQNCPDILITNYSMLEYMLMRPIERTIFQQTAEWLKQDAANTLLIVLDEAHLYSGVTGAEIALLLRRLQARMGIGRDRMRYILTSASLDAGDEGQRSILDFATTLVGLRARQGLDFSIIQGQRIDAPASLALASQPEQEADALATFDLQAFTYRAIHSTAGYEAVAALAEKLVWPFPSASEALPRYLGQQLPRMRAFRDLWKLTTGQARAFQHIAQHLFPILDQRQQELATSALLALSAAAISSDERPLLPARAHLFFRGLPPVYACVNPRCSARRIKNNAPSEIGALWLSPRLHCSCGARVYELHGHRNCGAIFLRVFAPGEPADFYWHEAGDIAHGGNNKETLLLIGQPHPKEANLEAVYLHIKTGRVIVAQKHGTLQSLLDQEDDLLPVYRPDQAKSAARRKSKRDEDNNEHVQHWASCPVCRKRLYDSSITSLSTKGEQPFVNLVRRQFELQPPAADARDEAPNMGRKVLLFSDGRQRAARLARDLPREVELDTFRQALLLAVAQRGERTGQPLVKMDNALYREFVAVCARYRLHFFDGESQAMLLRHIEELRDFYDLDASLAEDDDWEPPIPQGYRLALLRQVADRFYSMQRMCAAIVEPSASGRLLKKPIFTRLDASKLRALIVNWIEALLDVSAFDASISPLDRKETVPGDGFMLAGSAAQSESWNDAEKAAESSLGYAKSELQQLRMALVDEFCETKEGIAFLKPEKLALRLTLEDSWHQCGDCSQLIYLPLGGRCPNSHCGSTQIRPLPGQDPGLRARTDFYREPIRQVISGHRSPTHMTAEEHTAQLSYRDMQQVSSTTEQYELRFQDIGISPQRPSVDVLSCTTTMEVGVDIGSLLGIGLRTMPPRRANYQQRAGRAGRRGSALSTVLSYSENGSHDAHYFAHPDEMISGVLPSPQVSRVNERLARRHINAALIQTFFLEHIQQDQNKVSNRQYGYLAEALGTARAFFTTSESSSLKGFEDWLKKMLADDAPHLAQQIAAWVPDMLNEKPVSIQEKKEFVQSVARDFVDNLRRVGEERYPPQIVKDADGPNAQFDTRSEEMMLLELPFERGFLPTYAFPREVRSFVIEEWKQDSRGQWRIGIKQRPEQSVDIALSEYAPGREMVVDKATYRVGGIYVDPFPGATLATRVPSIFKQAQSTFVLCSKCGYTQQERTQEGTDNKGRLCPLCQTPLAIEEILDPPGFAPERARNVEARQLRSEGYSQNRASTQVQLVLPLTDKDDFGQKTAGGRVAWSFAEHRELLIMNRGAQGMGYSVCRSCGASSPEDPEWLQQAHDRPFLVPGWMAGPRKCNGSDGIWHGYLGHTFHSDLLLLRLRWPVDVAYHVGSSWMRDSLDTIAQALLLTATRLLDVATSELQVGWSYTIAAPDPNDAQPVIPRMADFFLFDTLSGGAGYATQVGQYMGRLLSLTQEILDSCPEQCERSCYRCLRTYTNRIIHHHLDRQIARTLLLAIINGHAPSLFSIEQQSVQLDALGHFLELVNVQYQSEGLLHGVKVPLLIQSGYEQIAVGTYPIQQEPELMRHLLDALPARKLRLFSDYELAHNLPGVAQSLLS